MKHIHLDQTTSTNTYLKDMIKAGEEFPDMTIVESEFQTGGRGQQGNSWESDKGENLTFSLLCHPEFIKAHEQFILSQAIALAVKQTLDEYTGNITVKWPNDIYWNDRKICGILIECNLIGTNVKDCIIGVGININQREFKSNAPNPVSLAQILGFSLNRKLILEKLLERFRSIYERLRNGHTDDIVAEYRQSLYRREGFHKYIELEASEPFEAEIDDIEPTGYLVLRLKNGEKRQYEFKQVKFII